MGRLLPTLIKIVFIRTGHCTSAGQMVPHFFASAHVNYASHCMSNIRSMEPRASNIRVAIVSAMSDVCGATNSTWFDMFIKSTSTPMAISSGDDKFIVAEMLQNGWW